MANLFTTILNMSLTAGIIILIVLLARLCLKRAPKIFSYVLWSVVLFRLLCPISISLPVSVLAPMSEASTSVGTSYTASMEYISLPERTDGSNAQAQQPVPGGNIENDNTNEPTAPPAVPEADTSAVVEQHEISAEEIVLTVLGWLWAAGVVGVLGITAWQTFSLKRRLADACIIRGNIFESDKIDTAFILGVFNPKIYLPLGLPFDIQKAVVAHEQTHQRRGDHIVKLVSYIALTIHWFNPLVWLSFKLMCDDMEKSCDEAVIRTMTDRGYGEKSMKKAYSKMLFALGGGKQHIFSPVSFAEHSIKERIINVTEYSRTARNVGIGLCTACVSVIALCIINPTAAATARRSSDAVQINIGEVTFRSNVTELDLSYDSTSSNITDISPLLDCTAVADLDLSGNTDIINLSLLAEMESIRSLDISGTSADDISFLTDMPNLIALKLDIKSSEHWEVLSRLTQLEELTFSSQTLFSQSFEHDGKIYEVDGQYAFFENFKNLQSVEITAPSHNMLKALSGIQTLRTLTLHSLAESCDVYHIENGTIKNSKEYNYDLTGTFLSVRNMYIEFSDDIDSLECLSNLTQLEKLYIKGNVQPNGERQRVDISCVSRMTQLAALTFEYIDLYDISAIGAVDNLTELSIIGSDISRAENISLPRGLTLLNLFNTGAQNKAGFTDIGFISELKNLESLSFYASEEQTDLSALESLSKLQNLTVIGLYGLHDISAVSSLAQLKSLDLYGDFTDISALSACRKLESLSLKGRFTDISALGSCTQLKTLTLNGNFTDIAPLGRCTALESLELYGFYRDISPLENCVHMTRLVLSGEFQNVNAIQQMNDINYISLTSERLTDISALSGLNNIGSLYIKDAALHDLSAIRSLPLETFGIERMQITDIDFIAEVDTLTTLCISSCPISDIEAVSGLPRMTGIFLSGTEVSDISPLYNLNALKYLWLEYNIISQSDIAAYLDSHPECIYTFNVQQI